MNQRILFHALAAVLVLAAGFGTGMWYTRSARSPAVVPSPGPSGGAQTGMDQGDEPYAVEKGGLPTEGYALYFVALDDDGAHGPAIGCGDSLIPVATVAATPHEALRALLSLNNAAYGDDLYNAVAASSLFVDQITSDVPPAVHLSGSVSLGGVCDTPRFQGQIESTIRQFPGFEQAQIFLNGEPMAEALSQR